jgi:ribonuclease P protein component
VEAGNCRKQPDGGGFRFPRKERLKGRDEIREVFSRKKGVSCPGVRLLMRRNGLPYNRIAFAFPRKFGNAVERNRSRRLSREVYRHLRNELLKGYDLVLLAYPEGNRRSLPLARRGSPDTRPPLSDRASRDAFSARMDQLRDLFSRAGLFKPPPNQVSL